MKVLLLYSFRSKKLVKRCGQNDRQTPKEALVSCRPAAMLNPARTKWFFALSHCLLLPTLLIFIFYSLFSRFHLYPNCSCHCSRSRLIDSNLGLPRGRLKRFLLGWLCSSLFFDSTKFWFILTFDIFGVGAL